MKYTRSAAQKSQQQLRHQLEEEQEDEEEEQIENNIKSSKNKVRKSLNNSKNKSKSSNKTKQSGRKSTSKKKKSKYFSDSEDDYDDNNNNNNYEYEDDIDVGDEYYEAEDDYAYESYINTNKKKVNKKTVPIAEDEIISDVDIELEDDENTQDTHATRKSQSSDNDYFNIFDNDDNSGDSLPELKLPKSSEDLLILNENILDCISVYETLRRFRNILRLSPFLFEDFCACLNTNENSSLFSEVHLSLIKILLKEDEVSLVSYGPTDLKTCIDVSFHLIDSFTWPEILRQYIESDMKMLSLNSNLLNILNKPTYPLVNISDKLTVLISLCNMFLSSLAVRNDLLSEGNIVSDDHCRICHKLGNLLCCETCPATYHLDCLDPPLTNVPEDDWICSICRLHQLHGVTDCLSEVEKTGLLIRHESLGYDRHKRKYWFLCRRIIVESESGNYYYSTKLQLDELIKTFDPTKYEAKLIRNINEQYEEIVRCMQITEDLTKTRKESKRSYFDEDNERIRKLNKEIIEKESEDELITVQDELLKIENSDDDYSNSNFNNEDVEEYYQIPQNSNLLAECDQLDGIVDNNNEVDVDEHELLPSNLRSNGHSLLKMNKNDNLSKLKINDLIPNMANQKVKILNDHPKSNITSNSDISQTITLLNKDSSRFKLSIIPNITQTNNSQVKITTVSNSNMLQDYEFGDPLKFVTNIKPNITSLDSESSVTPTLIKTKINEEKPKSEKLISAIFENLTKGNEKPSSSSSTGNQLVVQPLYKLGMESNYRMYENQYSVNPLTMNKHQHNQERDRKNILSRRFLISQEFNWKGNLFSNIEMLSKSISNTIISIENSIPSPFLHHQWPKYREKWIKKLHNSRNVIDFAKCLLELEASMKPVLFVSAWKDGTGYIKLLKETQQEREEHKKEDTSQFKRRHLTVPTSLDETSYQMNGQQIIRMAHFTKGIKHQVFKQKGEEYRLTGTGGWYWFHKTRPIKKNNVKNYINKNSQVKVSLKNLLLNNLKDKKCIESILVEEDNIPDADQPWFNNSLHPYLQVFNVETIDISENLVSKTLYPKEMRNKSKILDFLLEKRLKHNEELKLSNQQSMKKLEEKLIDLEMVEMKAKEAFKQEETDSAVASLENQMSVDEDEIKIREDFQISRDYVREKMKLDEKLKNILDKSKISLNGEYLVELDNELIKIPIVENNTKYRYKLRNVNKIHSAKSNDTKLPPYSNFMINNKTTIFLFSREITRLIARKGGFRIEIPGFKSDHHKQTVYWPYPCNRPLLKTCWCYKTFTVPNLSSLALQLRYFFSCIRWDAINERPPINSQSYQGGIEPVLTEHFDDYMQITELIKKRNVGMYGLRSEYLVRKKKIPYKKSIKHSKLNQSYNSTPNSSRTTSRRSGLRQLRQSIGQLNDSTGADTDSNSGILDSSMNQSSIENKNKYQPIEEWIGEERLHLWQIKSFHDCYKRLEMEEIRKKDRMLKIQQQQPQTTNIITSSNLSKLNTSSPKLASQIISQHQQPRSTINLLSSQFHNQQYKINESPSSIQNTKPILNMTKVIPRTTTITTSSPLQLSNLRVLNSTSSLNKTFQLNGQTVTVIAKPTTIPTINKQIIISSTPNVKTISAASLTQNSFCNLKINNQSTIITTTTTTSTPPVLITQKPTVVVTSQPIKTIPTPTLLSQTITPQTIKTLTEIQHKLEPTEQNQQQISPTNESSLNLDPNSRSRRTRKLPAKLNDSYDLTYDSGLNVKLSKPRPKSIQSILAQKEAEETIKSTITKVNTILSAPTVSTKLETLVKPVVSEQELLTKSEQLIEDIAKRKRQELLQKHADDLKDMIKFKKASMEVDVEESIRLDIDLDRYLDLKNRLAPNEFVNKIKDIERENFEKEIKEQELLEKQQQLKDQSKQIKQKLIIKKEEIVNTSNNNNNQNENEIINDIRHKRKSKLRPETISPLSVSKENVQQTTEDVKKLPKTDNINENENNKFEFIQKQHQQKTIESTNNQFEEEEEGIETNNKKRRLSSTANDTSLLNSSECSSGNHSFIVKSTKIKTNNRLHKLDSSLSDGEKQSGNKTKKTYCICNSIYDKKRFYIQCDKCANWYHGDCVNITPLMASTLETYICVKCEENNNHKPAATSLQKQNKRIINDKILNKQNLTNGDEAKEQKILFCICKKPYDEKRFYIGCDICQDWCHGSCVGILPLEACTLDTYNCPTCLKKEGKEWNLENKITSKNYELIKAIFNTIKNNRMAWPFLDPVNAIDVPNYYLIIKEPMDLSLIESRLLNFKYTKYIEFMYDMSKIIENCRLFNPVDSKFYKCANAIEKVLVQQLRLLKQRM